MSFLKRFLQRQSTSLNHSETNNSAQTDARNEASNLKSSADTPDIEAMKSRNDVSGLINFVNSNGEVSRRKAVVLALGELKDEQAVDSLINLIKHKGLSVDAINALGMIASSRSVKPLVSALENAHKDEREAIINALGRIGSPAIELLMSILEERDLRYQWYDDAIDALAKIGTPAIEPLVAALTNSKHANVRYNAAKALEKLGWQPDTSDANLVYLDAKCDEKSIVALGASAAEALISLRLEYTGFSWEWVAGVLEKIGYSAVDPLCKVLLNKEWDSLGEERKYIAEALGHIGDPRAIDALVAALDNKSKGVRDNAVVALGELGTPAVDALIAALKSDKADFQLMVFALANTGDSRVIAPLIECLAVPGDRNRRDAARALDKLGWRPNTETENLRYLIAKGDWDKCVGLGASAVDSLIALVDVDLDAGLQAISTLIKIGQPAVEPLIVALKEFHTRETYSGDLRGIIKTLEGIGDARAIEPLVEVLRSSKFGYLVHQAAAQTLKKLGWQPVTPVDKVFYLTAHQNFDLCLEFGELAVNPLVAALTDPNCPDETSIMKTLASIGEPAIEPLILALEEDGNDNKHHWYSKYLIETLGEIGDPRALPPVEAALKSEREYIRNSAAKTLEKLRRLSTRP